MNALMERWVQTCRRELLDCTLIWNQAHLFHALREFEQFYNGHRPPIAGSVPPAVVPVGHTQTYRGSSSAWKSLYPAGFSCPAGLSADVSPGGAVDVGGNAALVAVAGRQRPGRLEHQDGAAGR